MGKKIILTISILVSNNLENVRRCLDSIRPILDNVPSELILTDTGCDENTRTIIEKYTNNIIDFKWCDDFSEARNVGLSQAKGQWFMWVDDDEWFENVDDIIRFFESNDYKNYDVAFYYQRNYMNLEGTYFEDNMVQRMVCLHDNMQFKYSIHEVLEGINGNRGRLCKCYANHFGYVMTEDERTHKVKRNLDLLLKENQKNSEDLHIIVQLLQCYEGLQDWNGMLETVNKGRKVLAQNKNDENLLNTLCVYHTLALYRMRDYETAIKQGKAYIENRIANLYNAAGILKYIIPCYYETEQYDAVQNCVSKYLELYKEFEGANGKYNYQVTVSASYISQVTRDDVIGYGIRAAIKHDDVDNVKKYYEEYDWKDHNVYVDAQLIYDLIDVLPKSKDVNGICEILFGMTKQTDIADFIIQEVYAHSMFEHLSESQIDNNILSKVLLYIMKQELGNNFFVSSREVFEYWNGWMTLFLTEESLESLYWNVIVYGWKLNHFENEIHTINNEVSEVDKIRYALELFANYAQLMIIYCNNTYSEVETEHLTANQQVAFLISDLIDAMENNCLTEAVRLIRKIIKLVPQWKDALEYLPKWIAIVAQG